jgi:hypothetical protein
MTGLDEAYKELIKAGNNLCFMAETTGGTAGRDDGLRDAMNRWCEARNRVVQLRRIERFEPAPGVAVSAGSAALSRC